MHDIRNYRLDTKSSVYLYMKPVTLLFARVYPYEQRETPYRNGALSYYVSNDYYYLNT
jgi:hypothetical protein